MLLTESQAAEKWCPHARFQCVTGSGAPDPAANRWVRPDNHETELNPPACRCIGAQCMAWRWFDQAVKPAIRKVLGNSWAETEADADGRPLEVPADWEFRPATEEDAACWRESEAATNAKRRGYCGLVGLPKF